MENTETKNENEIPTYYRHGFRWYILFVFALVNAMTLFGAMGVAGIAPRVMMEYQIDPTLYSWMISITYLTGFLTCLFFGSFIDRFGARNVIVFGLVVGLLGLILRAAVIEYWAFMLGNFLFGFTFSSLNAGVIKVLKSWFAPSQFNVAIGIYIGAASLFAAISMNTANMFPTISSLLWFDVGFAVVTTICALFIKNQPADGPNDYSKERITQYLSKTLRYKSVWMAAVLYLLLYGASNAGNIYMVTALIQVHGADEATAGLVAMIGTAGCFVGSIILPAVTSRVGKSKPCLATYSAIMAIALALAWILPFGPQTTVLLFAQSFCLGGLLSGTKSLPGLIPELPMEYVGTAGGFQACLQNLGAFIIPSFILAPLSGGDMFLCFMMCCAIILVYFLLTLFMPKGMGIIRRASGQ